MDETIVTGANEVVAVPTEANTMTQPDQERVVPLSALEAERAKRQQLEESNRMMQEHFALLQAQQSLQRPQPPSQDEFEGMSDSDVMTVGDFKKHSQRLAHQFGMTLEELRMTQKHPDYQEVVSKYLPEVFKTNPSLRESLKKSQDYELAYHLAKNSDAYRGATYKQTKNEDAERLIRNSQQAGSLSSMGASTPVAQAKRYKDMSDEEFRNLAHRNMGY
jgi:hypothetical protein